MQGKRILLGITGSIAAYKSAFLVRLLVKAGAEVRVVMTPSSLDFITPLTLSVLSRNPVMTVSHDRENGVWNNHVDAALWADAMVIAPASANTIGKMANGMPDNQLLACYFSSRCPVFVAPAMDLDMLQHPAVSENIARIATFRNHHIIPSPHGELASGLTGDGRMEEPEKIFEALQNFFLSDRPLKGLKALVTAGPTFETIDPVRYIGNRSSGKMGFAIAEELARKGATVRLVSGPSAQSLEEHSVRRTDVRSAEEMYKSCMNDFDDMDIVVMAAAVADFRPSEESVQKIKKGNKSFSLTLEPTTDILKSMGERKKKEQILVGFALETDDELKHARTKLRDKNLDMIVLNSLNDQGAGFEFSTNKVTVIEQSGKETSFDLKPKTEVARDLVNLLVASLKK